MYAVAHIKGSTIPRLEVMFRKQIDAIRKRSQSDSAAKKYGKQTPWDTDYAEMAKKTVLKRLCKTLPMSLETQQGIAMDDSIRKYDPANDLPIDITEAVASVQTIYDQQTGEVIEEQPEAPVEKPADKKAKPQAKEPVDNLDPPTASAEQRRSEQAPHAGKAKDLFE